MTKVSEHTDSLMICPFVFLLKGIQAGASNSLPPLGSVMFSGFFLFVFLVHRKTFGMAARLSWGRRVMGSRMWERKPGLGGRGARGGRSSEAAAAGQEGGGKILWGVLLTEALCRARTGCHIHLVRFRNIHLVVWHWLIAGLSVTGELRQHSPHIGQTQNRGWEEPLTWCKVAPKLEAGRRNSGLAERSSWCCWSTTPFKEFGPNEVGFFAF